MTRLSGVSIGSMLLILALVLVACGQATAPASEPTEAPPAATTESAGDEEDEEVSDDQIREPVGHVETFWNSFDWADLTTAEQEAWGVLGWDEESWDEEINIPPLRRSRLG